MILANNMGQCDELLAYLPCFNYASVHIIYRLPMCGYKCTNQTRPFLPKFLTLSAIKTEKKKLCKWSPLAILKCRKQRHVHYNQ
jgi:hypothetical protein